MTQRNTQAHAEDGSAGPAETEPAGRPKHPPLPPHPRGPLVAISHSRLHAWLDRRGFTPAEVARRAGMSSQKLSLLLNGKVNRCRQLDREHLADILGLSIPYLAGDPDAPPPEVPPMELIPQPRGRPQASSGGPRPEDQEPRSMTEIVPLLTLLNRVFPWDPSQPHTGVRIKGITSILDLPSAQALVGGIDTDVRDPTDEEADAFAVDIARIFGAVLAPWLAGEHDVPPGGARLVSTLATILSALMHPNWNFIISEEYTAIISDLENIARRLDARAFRLGS